MAVIDLRIKRQNALKDAGDKWSQIKSMSRKSALDKYDEEQKKKKKRKKELDEYESTQEDYDYYNR